MQSLFFSRSPHLAYRKHSLTNFGRAGQPQQSSNLLGLPSKKLACLSLVARFPRQEVYIQSLCSPIAMGTDLAPQTLMEVLSPDHLAGAVKSNTPVTFPKKGGDSLPEISPRTFSIFHSPGPIDKGSKNIKTDFRLLEKICMVFFSTSL